MSQREVARRFVSGFQRVSRMHVQLYASRVVRMLVSGVSSHHRNEQCQSDAEVAARMEGIGKGGGKF